MSHAMCADLPVGFNRKLKADCDAGKNAERLGFPRAPHSIHPAGLGSDYLLIVDERAAKVKPTAHSAKNFS